MYCINLVGSHFENLPLLYRLLVTGRCDPLALLFLKLL